MALVREVIILAVIVSTGQCNDNKQSGDLQKEVAKNLILLENSNCNALLNEMECFDFKQESKWKFIDTFFEKDYHCKWDEPMDLKVPDLNPKDYVVKCPVRGERPAYVFDILTNDFLNTMGLFFRNRDVIVVPGEETRTISQDWDNGTKQQIADRLEIGANICTWQTGYPGPISRCFGKFKICDCMLNMAKLYYIATYSSTGRYSDVCKVGKMLDLHLPTHCEVSCPTLNDSPEYIDYAFTNINTYKVPPWCSRVASWFPVATD